MSRLTTSLTITDPLVKYHSLVATGVLRPDPAQHRLAHHLQKLHARLKDYVPEPSYRARLAHLTQPLGPPLSSSSITTTTTSSSSPPLALPHHPIWRNPLFSRLLPSPPPSTLSLTLLPTALTIPSPRGLFLSGAVGTGKSLLLGLLASCLPVRRRWHFDAFMLHALGRLEAFRAAPQPEQESAEEYPLLRLAEELVETAPVLFLDEFQLPDRAAAKIVGNLLGVYFQLGGVLVASSNRVPEELERASGGAYEPPVRGGLVGRVFGFGRGRGKGELFGGSSDFAAFLEVLRARCEFWHMEGGRDWRREGAVAAGSAEGVGGGGGGGGLVGGADGEQSVQDGEQGALRPAKYFVGSDGAAEWEAVVRPGREIPWQPARLVVYGRAVVVPRQHDGVALWDFAELVHSFGPADYITLAANYHTFIVDNVPVLPLSMKNEARRFITCLDALYEARCKLVVRAAAGPDDLFFPETRRRAPPSASPSQPGPGTATPPDSDAVYSETIAEVFQDQTSPFRPNTAAYNPDQDSDFGTEQDPARRVDFTDAGAFTGEDERFAYARAESRLWEMCGARWHARADAGWWTPVPAEARHWEGREPAPPVGLDVRAEVRVAKGDVVFGPVVELDGPVGLEGRNVAELRRREEERRATTRER